jgi:PleD family two-component response regulator
MMAEVQRILVVEDDPETAEMLNTYFKEEGYEVLTAAFGWDALSVTEEELPDLILLDIRLPDIDGYEVCHRLRGQRRTERIPIIFLTERRERSDRLTGLELGAVDYITKPFDVQELRLRVQNALRRAGLSTLVNPITGLPTGPLIDERLATLLRQRDWTVLSVSIHGLRDFSDSYGFVASDDVLRAVALMIKNAAKELGDSDPFIGHVGEADFIVISAPAKAYALRERIISRLDQAMEYFYPIGDREQNRGQRPEMSFSTAIVTAHDGPKSPPDVKAAVLNAQAPG